MVTLAPTALGEMAATGSSSYSAWDAFIGIIPGSIGETSVVMILLGAVLLIVTRIASWKIMLSAVMGALLMGWIFNGLAIVHDFTRTAGLHGYAIL